MALFVFEPFLCIHSNVMEISAPIVEVSGENTLLKHVKIGFKTNHSCFLFDVCVALIKAVFAAG